MLEREALRGELAQLGESRVALERELERARAEIEADRTALLEAAAAREEIAARCASMDDELERGRAQDAAMQARAAALQEEVRAREADVTAAMALAQAAEEVAAQLRDREAEALRERESLQQRLQSEIDALIEERASLQSQLDAGAVGAGRADRRARIRPRRRVASRKRFARGAGGARRAARRRRPPGDDPRLRSSGNGRSRRRPCRPPWR